VFAKGHLRRYATLMQLSGDDLLSGYERSSEQPVQPTLIPRSRTTMIPGRAPRKWPLVLGGMATFLLAGAVAAYLSANGLHLPGHSDAPSTGPAGASGRTDGDAGSPKAIAASDSGVTPGTNAAAPAAGGSDTAIPAGQLRLQLRFAADSWVEVYDGTGRAVLYDLGRSGSERVVTAVAPLSVTVGNAPAVSMSINGRRVALAAPPAGQTVARFSIGADAVLR
jgi:cytoskeletal protein RodZ